MFDGDEMNLHAPQSVEAATELRMIAAVPLQIVGPRESVPLVSVVQDTLVGANRFTRPDVLFTRKEAMNLLVHAKRWNGKLPAPITADPQPMWSGQQLMSALLPPVSLKMKNSSDQMVSIFQGAIQEGTFDKAVFSKQLIHIIFNDYGPDMTVDFLDSLQAMIANFLMNNGFSVGISDLIADSKTNEEIEAVLGKITKTVEDQILQLHTGLFENSSGRTNQEEFEAKLMATLNKAYTEAGKIGLSSLSPSNRMTNMVKAGSKGSDVNVSQMIATLGQISIEGKRVPKGFQHRTLPHFKRFDDSAQARGFSASSFIKGLQPDEFFFHAMSGREGLIDTAVKTADTGYLQRKIRVALEDLITQHDGSVRDAGGNLVQMAYGEDGANATKIEGQPLPIGEFSDEKLLTEYAAAGATDAAAYLDAARADRTMLVEKVFAGKPQRSVRYPVHLERLLFGIKASFHLKDDEGTATAQEVLEAQKTILTRTHANNRLWGALVRYHLRPVHMAKHGFTKPALDALVQQVVLKHWQSWVEPGQPVGIIAAQSIGEPATQMSVPFNCKIVIHGKNTSYSGSIGGYIDKLLEKHKDDVVTIGKDSVVLDLDQSEGDAIVGVSNDEKTSWLPIRQVSRHPANGGLVEVRTRTGRKTTATLTHSFLKRGPKGVEAVLGSALKVGDRIPVALKIDETDAPFAYFTVGDTTFNLDAEFGWVCGMYVADGCLTASHVSISKVHPQVETQLRTFCKTLGVRFSSQLKAGAYGPSKDNNIHSKDLRDFLDEHFKQGSFGKRIPDFMFHAPVEFICGFLRGYFDGDGNVSVTRQHIRLSSRNEELLRDTNRLLAYAGLFGVLGQETSVRIPDTIQYTLHIPKSYAAQFKKTVGFLLPEKAAGLDEICAYMVRGDKRTHQCELDKIPALGDVLAETGRLLAMPGQSRLYGRWAKKESIGRETLRSYLPRFKEALATVTDVDVMDKVMGNLAVLEAAAYSDVLWDEIVELVYHDDPHTFVYDFTVPGNDSFMVDDNILVHNTLNSVDYDTNIMIACDGEILAPCIGEFIDNYIETCEKSTIQTYPNGQIYVPLDSKHDWSAISCDAEGKLKWTKLEAVTRHPVINEDGTDTILEVETESGRIVKATKARSFLTFNGGKIVQTNGSDLKVGDLLPVSLAQPLPAGAEKKTLEVKTVLPPTEWLYGDEVAKALDALRAADEAGNRHWFSHANGRDFTVPYARSDSFRAAFAQTETSRIHSGCVYPKSRGTATSQIPSSIVLDKAFGYFVGAFLSEGSSSTTQIQITNNDDVFLAPIRMLLDSWSVGHHTVRCEKVIEKTGIKGHTQSLIIHSTLLTTLFRSLFGTKSHNKTFPAWVLQAPADFVAGLVDGYFSGDGSISKLGYITAISASPFLGERMGALLARFGIHTTHHSWVPKRGKFASVADRHYNMCIPASFAQVFGAQFTLTDASKQARLTAHLAHKTRAYRHDTHNDVLLDKVKTIKEISPKGGLVYDVTVAETRNFQQLNGVGLADTFHLSGVAAKSNMTRGVPRLNELLKATKKPKATELVIPMRRDLRDKKEEARRLARELEFTLLKDIVTVARIYYDPRDNATLIQEDADWLAYLAAFEATDKAPAVVAQPADPLAGGAALVGGAAAAEEMPAEPAKSPFILRFELDRERMFAKDITMDDIAFVLKSKFPEVETLYTDYNATRLVFRIRIIQERAAGPATTDDLNNLKALQNKILTSTAIRGVPGLRSVNYVKTTDTVEYRNGTYDKVDQYTLVSDGSNFLEVIAHPDVDATRVVSSDIYDMFNNLGIEATRAVLYKEISTLFAESGVSVNYRHISVMLDKMCHKGRVMSIDRYGINKNDIGPLAKMSFEQTEDMALRAALFGERDPCLGISAKVMLGAPIRAGTAFTEILLDEIAAVKMAESTPAITHKQPMVGPGAFTEEELDDALFGQEEETGPCAPAELRMKVPMPIAPIGEGGEEALEEKLDIVLVD